MYHHGLFIQPNITLLTCLQRLCDHTFCLPMMHLTFFVYVSVFLMCVVHSHLCVTELPVCVCIYNVSIEKENM